MRRIGPMSKSQVLARKPPMDKSNLEPENVSRRPAIDKEIPKQ
jgi:hypothetical protein